MKDIEGRYLLINKRYEDLFSLKNQEVQGKTDLDIFPKEIADNFIKNDQNVMESGYRLKAKRRLRIRMACIPIFQLRFH
jgi:hypothetical protein